VQSDGFESILDRFGREDHLGRAAEAKHAALRAVKAGDFDRAWGLFHEQKDQYARHAARTGFSAKQILALDGTVSEDLANVLRLECKHRQALVHITYWVATSPRRTKTQTSKLRAYFNRAKLAGVSLSDLETFIASLGSLPEFRRIQEQMRAWFERADDWRGE